jgi:ribonuclease BN (tRNA processing enzyme)
MNSATRVLLLGTGAGPTPKLGRNPTAAALLYGESAYIVDCGNGVGLQLTKAGIAFGSLRGVFITHHHFDHVADFATLIAQGWTQLRTPLPMRGPPPLARMTELFQELFAVDLASRVAEEGRKPFATLVDVQEIVAPGLCFTDDHVRVACTLVNHGTIAHAFAYRFDCPDRSVVFSGDTAYAPQLVELARGAHTLVHEAAFLPAIGQAVPGNTSARQIERIIKVHSSVEQAAQVAQAAGVAKLVLSPLVPATGVTNEQWTAAAAQHFTGEIVVGRDLLVA